MFDTAEEYAGGKSEKEMWSSHSLILYIGFVTHAHFSRGLAIRNLGLRRSDLVISTKIYWGPRKGPNDSGLSRKQYVCNNFLNSHHYCIDKII